MVKMIVPVLVAAAMIAIAGCGSQMNSSEIPAGMKVTRLSAAQMDAVNAHMAKVRGGK